MNIPQFQEIFKQIKINFWLIGIPFDEPKIHIRFYLMLMGLILVVTEEALFFVSEISAENFLELTQLAPCTCIGILSIVKLISIVMKRHKIFKLCSQFHNLYDFILKDSEKIDCVKSDFIFLKHLVKYYFILNGVLISVYNFSTLIIISYYYITTNEVKFILPYAVLVPFSIDSWTAWLVVYLHSIICGFICVLYFTTVDALYYIMTCHMYCHFTILSQEIQGLDANNVHLLRKIVGKHQYILQLSEDLEDIFSAANLFNVLVGSVEICALGFNLTMGKWTQIPGVVLFLVSVLLQILMMSVFGENMIRESRKVGEATFLCKWYTMEERYKKTILLLILRSNKPQRLTAYKFSVISYESFTKIISTSWSYFTILKAVYKPPEQ